MTGGHPRDRVSGDDWISRAYPRLGTDVSLHLTPDGALLFRDGDVPAALDAAGQTEVNRDAAALLVRCDGRTTLADIIGGLTGGAPQSAPERITDFLRDMLAGGVVELHDAPSDVPPRMSGSFEFRSPSHASLELTDACNLTCLHCYRDCAPATSGILSTAEWGDVIETLAHGGVRVFELTGGEPTLHGGFPEIVAAAAEHANLTAVISNGTLLSDKVVRAIAGRGNVIVQVDLDGAAAAEHDRLRGVPGAFDAVLAGMGRLRAAGVRFRVAMNVYRGNLGSLERVAAMAHDQGASWFSASTILDVGRARTLEVLTGAELTGFIARLRELESAFPRGFVFTGAELLRQRGETGANCGAGWRTVTVGPRGRIRPCVMFPDGLGDFGDARALPFESEAGRARAGYLRALVPPNRELCGECRMLPFCTGCILRPLLAAEEAVRLDPDFRCAWSGRFSVFETWRTPVA